MSWTVERYKNSIVLLSAGFFLVGVTLILAVLENGWSILFMVLAGGCFWFGYQAPVIRDMQDGRVVLKVEKKEDVVIPEIRTHET